MFEQDTSVSRVARQKAFQGGEDSRKMLCDITHRNAETSLGKSAFLGIEVCFQHRTLDDRPSVNLSNRLPTTIDSEAFHT